jgi:YihY family inner membrane protein
VIRRTSQRTLQDNCLGLAAELAFFFFLALFPALLFFVALASFFPIDQLTAHALSALSRFAPPDVLSLIRDQFLQISKSNNGGLLTLGFVGAVWSASSGMSSAMGTLNQAYHVQETCSWWCVRLVAVALTVVLAAFSSYACRTPFGLWLNADWNQPRPNSRRFAAMRVRRSLMGGTNRGAACSASSGPWRRLLRILP